MRELLGGALRGRRAQAPLAAFSLLMAAALLIADLLDSPAVGGPVGFIVAGLFLLNGAIRVALWRMS